MHPNSVLLSPKLYGVPSKRAECVLLLLWADYGQSGLSLVQRLGFALCGYRCLLFSRA